MMKILSAKIESENKIEIILGEISHSLNSSDFNILGVSVLDVKQRGAQFILKTSPLNIKNNYRIQIKEDVRIIQHDKILNRYFSNKSLGCRLYSDHTQFRLFAPRASSVKLVLYTKFEKHSGNEFQLGSDEDGIWEIDIPGKLPGYYYGYCIDGPKDHTEMFDPGVCICDPYAKAVVSENHYLHHSKGIILKPDHFNWEGDCWLDYKLSDLIIYEMHIRDMTAHVSSNVSDKNRGRYMGLIEDGSRSGLSYLKSLGINAVEFLPIQEFANLEIDYKNSELEIYNDWNPYARNHWGYMTSNFFSPESYYASDGTLEKGQFSGISGRGAVEFKEVVKRFHQEGIAVILDVVYNHVSHYDLNPLKWIDKKYYFRLDENQEFLSKSYCGNDLYTERPMVRRLIIDSLLHWMEEYHIDGFRFDLAALIDEKTLDIITQETRKVNPNVILIAEPWGGDRYGQEPFSKRGWGAWNDRFRNGIKGENPENKKGFIFGQWLTGESKKTVKEYIVGSTQQIGGPYIHASHSVNYLSCHDNYTLGDFIRIVVDPTLLKHSIQNMNDHILLNNLEQRIHRLAALFLLTSQGTVMIHAGQEFARSKVIAPTMVLETQIGFLDHNSYNKDDETNWINYDHVNINHDLFAYYQGLIRLRKHFPVFRKIPFENIHFLDCPSDLTIAYYIDAEPIKNLLKFVVAFNSDQNQSVRLSLPNGYWNLLVNHEKSGIYNIKEKITGDILVEPISGMVLKSNN